MISLDQLLPWPLIVTIEDCYVPRVAASLLRGLIGLSDETARVSILLYAEDAAAELGGQVN
jgi:hypothetical protein